MPTSPTPDDLLALARFCFLDKDAESYAFKLGLQVQWNGVGHGRDLIDAAEAVLIERGLDAAYSLELIRQLDATTRRSPVDRLVGYSVARIRTAPLDVCVRAMVQVVKQQQKEADRE